MKVDLDVRSNDRNSQSTIAGSDGISGIAGCFPPHRLRPVALFIARYRWPGSRNDLWSNRSITLTLQPYLRIAGEMITKTDPWPLYGASPLKAHLMVSLVDRMMVKQLD